MDYLKANPNVLAALILGIAVVIAVIYYSNRTPPLTDEQRCVEAAMANGRLSRAQATVLCRLSNGALGR